jgi:hypothetical protein
MSVAKVHARMDMKIAMELYTMIVGAEPMTEISNDDPSSQKEPLRVALLINSYQQPQWIHKVISDVIASSAATIVLIVKNDSCDEGHQQSISQRLSELYKQRHNFLYKVYSRLDARLFTQKPDAFEKVSIEPLITKIPHINVKPFKKKFSDYFPETDVAEISKYGLDVAIRFGFRILRGDALRIAKHGVWSYHHGDNLNYRGGPPGFWEVMEGNPVTGAVLQILSEDLDNGQVICRSFAETDEHSVTRNANRYYWQASQFVARKLRELHEIGPCALRDPIESEWVSYSSRLYKAPRNGEICRMLVRLGAGYISSKLKNLFYFKQWFVAYKISPDTTAVDQTYYSFRRLIPPKDRFWADPFPVKREGKYYIFFEELLFKTGKGHLSVVEVDRKGMAGEPLKILDRPYHLSYPFVFQWNGRDYMVPETKRAKQVELYRCVGFPDRWEFDRVLLSSVQAVDTTLAQIDDRWWMFTSLKVECAQELYELHLFYADTPLGPWTPHKCNPVKADARSTRPAGKLIRKGGTWYRPAQVGAGQAMSINRIERLSPEEFRETPVSGILPRWAENLTGTHTLNSADGLTVIDGQLNRSRV